MSPMRAFGVAAKHLIFTFVNGMTSIAVNYFVFLFAIIVYSLSTVPDSRALRLLQIVVPEYVFWNKQAELECSYDLEKDEKLYRVQWYKDNDEFYRFDQKNDPRQFTYNIDEIKVDKIQSNERRVVLRNVNLMMRGVYKCEVSAEAPSFSTVYGEARMEVIAVPKEGPQIEGEKSSYQIGDTINLTCISARSYPPTRLRWLINNREFHSDYETIREPSGLIRSKSRISFRAGPQHFVDNHVQIKCQASIIGNHSLLTLPQHSNNVVSHPSKPAFYQKDAFISVKGNTKRIEANAFFVATLLCFCVLLNGITESNRI